MTALLWALVAVPLGGGAALAAGGRPVNRLAPGVALAVAGVTAALAVAVSLAHPQAQAPFLAGIGFRLRVDVLSEVFALTVSLITVLVLTYAVGELGADPARYRFFGLMLVFAGAMLVTVTAGNLLALLMGWEVMGATSYALIAHWWAEPPRVAAGNIAFWTTRFADVGLYLAAAAALAGAHTLSLAALPHVSGGWRALVTGGLIVAALGKSAQLPFSFWLSRAMEGPSPVSALLHSAAMVAAGGYLLLRVHPLLDATGWGASVTAWVGAATALALGAVAVSQRDLKQLLAASTCSQIAFIVLAAGADSVGGGTMQFVAHAATKSLLFLAAGAWLAALGTKDLLALRGAARTYRGVGVTAAVGLWALASLPPLSLWVTKDEVLAGALHRSTALYLVGLAAVAMTGAYAVKALVLLWQPLPADAERGYDTERSGERHVSGWQRVPLFVLATLAATLAVLVTPAVDGRLKAALGASGEPSSTWWELAASAAVALIAALVTAARPRRPFPLPAAAYRWLDLQRAAVMLVALPVLRLAELLARFDDRLLDGAVVERGVAAGVRRLGRLARRPQTGQAHHYYAQAVAALGVLFVVFLLAW